MTDIKTDAASLEPGEYVELFDMVLNDNEHLRFYDGQKLKSPGTILWQAMEYYPFPIQAEGFELTSGGRPPRPTLSVSNITGLVGLYAALRDDLVGNTVTRWRTFRHYLDGEPQADPAQHFPPDIFVINRKVSHTSELLTFELSTPFDQTSKVLPGRIAQNVTAPGDIGTMMQKLLASIMSLQNALMLVLISTTPMAPPWAKQTWINAVNGFRTVSCVSLMCRYLLVDFPA